MINALYKHSTIISFLAIFCHSILLSSEAKIRDFETTRLKSTAGAGAGSLLMDEATILNPAPIAFFKLSSFYINKSNSETTSNGSSIGDSDDMGIIVSDSKGNVAGSFSFNKQSFAGQKRQRLAASFASLAGKTSAMGLTIRRTTDEIPGLSKESYIQTVFGISHSMSQEFTLGFVAVDPMKKRVDDTMGTLGAQYVFKDFISLMADVGANYYKEVSETINYKFAVQFKIYQDFYARAGYFRDLGKNEKGTGVGAGWVQPKLVIEAALKNVKSFENVKVSETSFSLSYRF